MTTTPDLDSCPSLDTPRPDSVDVNSVDADSLYTVGDDIADTKAPDVADRRRWDERRFKAKLVNPANRRKLSVIIVGTGLAGASAAATLGEAGYQVTSFCYQDSPRRAHSIAAQGGINAAKNYRNDGDSIYRLFYDTVKGGDFRARESNVYRLAEVSAQIIDQCVAQGVPFAREYGGLLDNRSFGGVQVSRTFYARGQTGQQLLIGAYQALERQIAAGTVTMHTRHEMLELIIVDGRARGIVVRDMVTGEIETHFADAVVLATGGYGNVFFLSTNAMGCNVTATWRAHRKGAYSANPCYTQIHPTCIPVSRRLPVQADLDERVAAQRRPDLGAEVGRGQARRRDRSPSRSATTTWSGSTRRSATWCRATSRPGPRRTSATRAAGSGPGGLGVYLDFADAIKRLGRKAVEAKYGNLFDMYAQITGENPYETPMRIYPAVHYTMGGLWVDYDLESSIPGLYVTGEANFSDHGANRLGATALMQGLADGYFVLPNTINDYLAGGPFPKVDATPPGGRRGGERGQGPDRQVAVASTAPGRSTPSTRSSATSCGTTAGWSGPRRACARRSAGSAELKAGVLVRRQGAGHQRGAEPGAGAGRPGGRLLRARRADVHRCAGSARVLRWALPGGVADRGRRGAAATTTSSRTCRPGSSAATAASRSCTRSPWCTSTSR